MAISFEKSLKTVKAIENINLKNLNIFRIWFLSLNHDLKMCGNKDISKYFACLSRVFYSWIGHSKTYEWRSPNKAG